MQLIHWARLDRLLSAGPSSPLVPNHHSMKASLHAPWQQETCMDLVDSFRWTIPQRNINQGDFFSPLTNLFFLSPTQKFPPTTKKSKLLKDWVHSSFDFFWYVAPLKRDLATRQYSEDEHCPSDSTQCQCLSLWKTEREREEEKNRGNDFVTCYGTVSIFNFKFILKFKHWSQCDELFSQRQQKVSSLTFSYFMYSNHLQTS